MHYQPYFTLSLLHNYYRQGICADLSIEPTRACRDLLQNHRMVFQSARNGLEIRIAVGENGQPIVPVNDSFRFTFLLRLKEGNFLTFTNLDPGYRLGENFYFFSTEKKKITGDSVAKEIELETTIIGSGIEASGTLDARPIFGTIDLHHRDSRFGSANPNADFRITFTAKRQYWTYYLIANPTVTETFSIQEERKSTDGGTAIAFSGVTIDALVTNDLERRILEGIQQSFPDSRAIVLRSTDAIPCRESGDRKLQLVTQNNTKPWINALPNPPDRHGRQVINLLSEL